MKILIADTVVAFRDALTEQLKRRHTVICCDDGNKAVKLICEKQPDILLLNMALPGFDGLSILQAIECSCVKPRILAMSNYLSDHIVSELKRLSVDYILQTPTTVCAAMAQINALVCECEELDGSDDYRKLDQLLHTLGFRKSLGGYNCVCEALYLVRYAGMQMMTKEVYPEVAKICGGNAKRVEKAIRDAIQDAWLRRSDEIWGLYFPINRNGSISCPRNTEFLLAFSLRNSENRKIV